MAIRLVPRIPRTTSVPLNFVFIVLLIVCGFVCSYLEYRFTSATLKIDIPEPLKETIVNFRLIAVILLTGVGLYALVTGALMANVLDNEMDSDQADRKKQVQFAIALIALLLPAPSLMLFRYIGAPYLDEGSDVVGRDVFTDLPLLQQRCVLYQMNGVCGIGMNPIWVDSVESYPDVISYGIDSFESVRTPNTVDSGGFSYSGHLWWGAAYTPYCTGSPDWPKANHDQKTKTKMELEFGHAVEAGTPCIGKCYSRENCTDSNFLAFLSESPDWRYECQAEKKVGNTYINRCEEKFLGGKYTIHRCENIFRNWEEEGIHSVCNIAPNVIGTFGANCGPCPLKDGVVEIPSQPKCRTVFEAVFNWDGRAIEAYEFTLRLSAFIAGAAADLALGDAVEVGDFTGDVSDVFDLYMMGAANTELLNDGGRRAAYSSSYFVLGEAILGVSYLFILIRMFLPFYFPESDQTTPALVLSLVMEVAFLFFRLYSWLNYSQPISLLLLKNIVSIFAELHTVINPPKQEHEMVEMDLPTENELLSDEEENYSDEA